MMRRNILDLVWIFPIVIVGFATITGCIRRTSDSITEDYDEIDRKDPPLFINNTRIKVVVAAGKTATLECRVQNLGDRTVSWIRKNDLHILTMGTIVYTNDHRVKAVHPNASDSIDWNLDIEHAEVTDSGIYECQINTEPKKSKAYILQVVVSRGKILGDRDVLVQHGSDINLTCRAEESPEPPKRVIWYRNSVPVDSLLSRGGISVVTETRRRSSTLLVSKVTKEDAGNYTCAPTNAQADSVMVHVIEGADPRANVMAGVSSIHLGYNSVALSTFIFVALLSNIFQFIMSNTQ